MGKMCHVMSIDEKVTCVGGFNLLISEWLVVSGQKNRVDLILTYSHLEFFVARRSYFASKQGLRV